MPVAVRNTEGGPTVFSIPEKHVEIEWQGKGDPNGLDVQHVPDDLITNVQFAKMVRRGLFEILADEDAEGALDAQAESFQNRTAAADAAAKASMDPQVNNDLVQAPCIGPANRGNGECGEPVAVRENTLRTNDKPVLCSRHEGLAPQYAQVETSEMREVGDSLEPVKKWVRTTVTPREKQQ